MFYYLDIFIQIGTIAKLHYRGKGVYVNLKYIVQSDHAWMDQRLSSQPSSGEEKVRTGSSKVHDVFANCMQDTFNLTLCIVYSLVACLM